MKQVYFFICCFFVFCASSVQSQINYQSGFTDAVEKTPDFLSNSTKVHTESVYKIPQKSTLLEEWKEQESMLSNHIIGFYIHQLLWGRFTISYERLFADKTLGIKIGSMRYQFQILKQLLKVIESRLPHLLVYLG